MEDNEEEVLSKVEEEVMEETFYLNINNEVDNLPNEHLFTFYFFYFCIFLACSVYFIYEMNNNKFIILFLPFQIRLPA